MMENASRRVGRLITSSMMPKRADRSDGANRWMRCSEFHEQVSATIELVEGWAVLVRR